MKVSRIYEHQYLEVFKQKTRLNKKLKCYLGHQNSDDKIRILHTTNDFKINPNTFLPISLKVFNSVEFFKYIVLQTLDDIHLTIPLLLNK